MRIAMLGTRGVPAKYGGFETAVEEIGLRLVRRGHEVTVYGRDADAPAEHLGMHTVHRKSARSRSLETITHTALSLAHARKQNYDFVFVFNAANAPLLHFFRIPGRVAIHVDGLEWKRGKWGPLGSAYYRWAERQAVNSKAVLIADAQAIADFYASQYSAPTEVITYGTKILDDDSEATLLAEAGLAPRSYHLVVARMEPENQVLEIVRAAAAGELRHPLVVAGDVPYSSDYSRQVREEGADEVKFLGAVWDQDLLDQLYANSFTYIHGHTVGGTNPSLLRAMGAGAFTLAFDCSFNREVLEESGAYWRTPRELLSRLREAEARPPDDDLRRRVKKEVGERYSWDRVAQEYERLAMAERR